MSHDKLSENPDKGPNAITQKPPPPSPPNTKHSSETKTPPFRIGVAEKNGKELLVSAKGFSDPCVREARGLVFDVHINKDTQPTTADMEFYRNLAKVEHALQELYPDTDPDNEAKFRPFFVRLFYLAQLILEGDEKEGEGGKKEVGGRLSPEAAKAEVTAIANDLIDDEAPRIKNGHLLDLARWAGRLSLGFLAAYVVLMLFHKEPKETGAFIGLLVQLKIDPVVAANFMLLWVGTFIGVCLSYAIRTHEFSLSDLTRTDIDYLDPKIRLVLAGTLAMVLTILCIVGLGDVEFGSVKLSEIATKPMLAFVVGVVLGVSEQKLSGTIEKRVGDLFGGSTK